MESKAKMGSYVYRQLLQQGETEEYAQKVAAEEAKLGIRALDLFVWAVRFAGFRSAPTLLRHTRTQRLSRSCASLPPRLSSSLCRHRKGPATCPVSSQVLLGNTELARVLLGTCEEPMRAALLGAKLCNHMAELLTIEAQMLERCAKQHEDFAINLLDLCPTREEAEVLLLTPSRHWNRNVLGLAVNSEMKNFLAHRHVQNLVTRANAGDVPLNMINAHGATADSDATSEAHSQAMLPARFSREPAPTAVSAGLILAHAVFPCVLSLRTAPTAQRLPIWSDFYHIPYV